MRALCIVKVKSVLLLQHRDSLAVSIVLEDQLLQVQKGALVRHFLAHLHRRLPHVLRGKTRAVGALSILHYKFHLKDLLQDSRGEYFLLYRQLHSQALAVRLRPYEVGVNQAHRLETLELLQADRQQLARLELRNHPGARRVQVALAVTAKVDRRLLRY